MHLLRHLTIWGLCAAMLSTQPSMIYAAQDSSQNVTTYSTEDTSGSSEESDSESSEDTTGSSSSTQVENVQEEEEESSNETGTESESSSSSSDIASSTEEYTESETEETSAYNNTTSAADEVSSEKKASSKNKSSKNKKEEASDTRNGTSDKSANKDDVDTDEEKELKEIDDTVISEEESAEKDEEPSAIIPKIYGSSPIVTRDDAEYMGNFVYFNQGDSVWNQNGYQIAAAGCGPTSMAIVLSSLTDKWVTPLDATIWAYKHGYYSSAGSSHSLIPDMSEAYGLTCKGVGTDYAAIKKALKKGKPVVALMGPGYFTRKGHFMVLIDIDQNDNVTVADVGSRTRSSYKYALSDIISQSKSASAGGPFWVISRPKKKKTVDTVSYLSPQNDYVIYVKDGMKEKAITFHLGDKVSYNDTCGLIVRFENRKAYVMGENGKPMTTVDGSETIPLEKLQIVKGASHTVYMAIASVIKN